MSASSDWRAAYRRAIEHSAEGRHGQAYTDMIKAGSFAKQVGESPWTTARLALEAAGELVLVPESDQDPNRLSLALLMVEVSLQVTQIDATAEQILVQMVEDVREAWRCADLRQSVR